MFKSKGFKIFIIAILLMFFLFGALTIYKFIVINKVFEQMGEYVKKENYYMKVTNTKNTEEVIEIYYKDGIGKMISADGVYTWTNGDEAYLIDEENKKVETLDFNSTLLISNEYVGSLIPGYSKDILQRFLLAGDAKTSIRTRKYEDVKYYVITTNEEYEKKVWLKKDTLIPSQTSVKIGEAYESYNYDIEFNVVRDEQVKRPNIEKYTFVE